MYLSRNNFDITVKRLFSWKGLSVYFSHHYLFAHSCWISYRQAYLSSFSASLERSFDSSFAVEFKPLELLAPSLAFMDQATRGKEVTAVTSA